MHRPIPLEELLTHAAWLRRLAASLVSDRAEAEDAVQETWLAALRRPPGADAPPRRWLARVLRNATRNRARAETRRGDRERLAGAEARATAPDELASEAEAQRLLAESVVELAEPLRAVIVLRYFRGLDSQTTARELGVPPGTVRWRTSKALEELRAVLDRRSGGGRDAWMVVLAPLARRELAPEPLGTASSPAFLTVAALGIVAFVVLTRTWIGTPSSPPAPQGSAALATGSEAGAGLATARVASGQESTAREPQVRSATSEDSGAGAAAASAEISGIVLVAGGLPRTPLALELRADRPPQRAVDARDLPPDRPTAPEVVTSRQARVEQDGAFRFAGLSPGFRGRLRAEGYDFEESSPRLVTAPTTGLVLRLRREPALTGRLLDASGAALPELDGLVRYEIESEAPGGAGDVSALMPFRTDAEGSFRIPLENAEEGTTARAALVVEHERGRAVLETAEFDPFVGLDLGDIELAPVRTLRLRVRDALGAPVPGAVARVVGPIPCSRASAPAGADGECTLGFAPEGALQLRVDALRFRTRFLAVADGENGGDGFDAVLEPVAGLVLRLSAEDPGLLRTVLVLLRGPRELLPAAPGTDEGPQALERELESYLREELGATPLHGNHGGSPDDAAATWRASPPADGCVVLPGLAAGIPFELEVRARDERVLAARTLLLGPGEWPELELVLDP